MSVKAAWGEDARRQRSMDGSFSPGTFPGVLVNPNA
jgi:hypothetical protein